MTLADVLASDESLAAATSAAAPPVPPSPRLPGLGLGEWLSRPTGPGDLEEYRSHPLDPTDGSKPWGQRIARGATGLLGGGRLAIFDLGVGAFGWLRDRAAAALPKPTVGGGGPGVGG